MSKRLVKAPNQDTENPPLRRFRLESSLLVLRTVDLGILR